MKYDVKSKKAEEFINHAEILDTLSYAEAHKEDAALIDKLIDKAERGGGAFGMHPKRQK